MKLIVKNGESIDNAIEYLRNFLEQYKEDCFLLKRNMNVYITLEGIGHAPYPDNDREYVLNGGDPEDIEEKRMLYDEILVFRQEKERRRTHNENNQLRKDGSHFRSSFGDGSSNDLREVRTHAVGLSEASSSGQVHELSKNKHAAATSGRDGHPSQGIRRSASEGVAETVPGSGSERYPGMDVSHEQPEADG